MLIFKTHSTIGRFVGIENVSTCRELGYFRHMIFPIGDTNVVGGYKPLFCYTFIVLNIAIFLLQVSVEGQLVCEFATIPNEILAGEKMYSLLSSMFMHGSWMHLIGNMLFLWVFADNIEAVIGNGRFLFFYILGGVFASGLHIFLEVSVGQQIVENCCAPCLMSMSCESLNTMCSGSTPALGASGAISAVLGAYVVMFPKSRIKVFFFFTTFTVSALLFLGLWFLEQFIAGVSALGKISSVAGGVAWWAHIGGFLFGLLYGFAFRKGYDIEMKE